MVRAVLILLPTVQSCGLEGSITQFACGTCERGDSYSNTTSRRRSSLLVIALLESGLLSGEFMLLSAIFGKIIRRFSIEYYDHHVDGT